MLDIHSYFTVPLVDLRTENENYAGIFVPAPEMGAQKVGITQQFLENAEVYHNRYAASSHWLDMFTRIFAQAGRPQGENLNILDIGTGSGVNTVIPFLELFPGCRIVGTDLSPQLLRLLQAYVASAGLQDQVACVCTDAMRDFFKAGSADIVIGGAILHHLIDPVACLKAAHRALKPGGIAVFIEPFEGYSVLRAAFSTIISRAEATGEIVNGDAVAFMKRMMLDYEVRAGRDKSAPIYPHLDDKWLFTRTYIKDAAREAGFASAEVVPMYPTQSQYRSAATNLLGMGDLDATALPDWAWQIIDTFDVCFSDDLKGEATMESGIVFRR
ncbi:class I SAM-dependent methyltransferase [Xanthobacter sp. VNH20]|uniref:class I SAM-dependent methyltransferase n=1 Tax=Xanthobacter sp. VNH20 TaxID=3156616 RepID=UPI0032B584C8